MRGLMMEYPLTTQFILARAETLYPTREIATKTAEGMHRYTYADMAARARRLASALTKRGLQPGDRVGSFAWNTYRHLELYFAVPSAGMILHTLNIRLFADQIEYIVNHAEDQVIFVDESLVPVLEKMAPAFKTVKLYVIMSDGPMPQTSLSPAIDYEALLGEGDADYTFPPLDEYEGAMMCYTSGTTGNPKGVLYSHRSLYLHSLSSLGPDVIGLKQRDTVMPIVPMFHANSWGFPFTAALAGSKQVFPSMYMQPQVIIDLIRNEAITVGAGVPTIWIGVAQLLGQSGERLPSLHTIVCGGSAAPQSLIETYARWGISLTHAWGMTETSPLGSVCRLKVELDDLSDADKFKVLAKQGLMAPSVEVRIVNELGETAPWDGKTMGELQIRGPYIVSGYYNDERSASAFQDGWFRTGDVAVIDPSGYIQLVDRTKDLVKSGGEWISTVDLESTLMAHPKVLEAAVIAVPHPKWQERPLACVVLKPGVECSKDELYEFLEPRIARWWMPDDIVFIDAIPKTSVGKFDKKVLRVEFQDYTLPERPHTVAAGAGE